MVLSPYTSFAFIKLSKYIMEPLFPNNDEEPQTSFSLKSYKSIKGI